MGPSPGSAIAGRQTDRQFIPDPFWRLDTRYCTRFRSSFSAARATGVLSLLTKPVAKCSQPPRASPWRRGIVGALGVLGVVDDRVEVDVGEEPADGESSLICASVAPDADERRKLGCT